MHRLQAFPPKVAPAAFAAFAMGLILALATSGAILEERVSAGSVRVALLANLAITSVAITLLAFASSGAAALPLAVTGHARRIAVALPQILGALAGILLVHAAVRRGAIAGPPWLCEQPAQLVNDAVAVFAILAVLWGCARDLDSRWLALALVVVTVYRATALHWHLDRPPHGFQATVQELIVAQFIAVALGAALFRTLRQPDET
jgi:hypothetical protein